jgi:hypothetical protein
MVTSTPQSVPNKTLTVDGTELLMSYGMFNDIMRIIGSAEEAVEYLMNDPGVRDNVIRRLFTPELRKPVENIEDLINPWDIPVSPLELDIIIAWVADHVMHFTMSTALKTRTVVEKYQAPNPNPAS